MHTVLTVEAHAIEVKTGGWCPTCSLPSVVTATIAFASPRTLKLLGTLTESFCPECGT